MNIGQHAPFDQPWTLLVCHLNDPGAGSNLIFQSPPDLRLQIISVDGNLLVPGLGSPSRVQLHIDRSGRRRCYVMSTSTLSVNTTWEFHFNLYHRNGLQDKSNSINIETLPDQMWMEPIDQLHIERITSLGTDRFSDVSVTAKAFKLKPANSAFIRIRRAIFE